MSTNTKVRLALSDATDRANQRPEPAQHDKKAMHVMSKPGLTELVKDQSSDTTKTGCKRPAPEELEKIDTNDIDLEGCFIDANCDQIRRKIRRYLDSGAKVGEFCRTIDVTNHSLNTFLGQHGAYKGAGSKTYGYAWEFFKKREMVGVKEPVKKQKTSEGADKSAAKIDLSGVRLPEEEQGRRIKVYDTCDEIRKKISAHFTKTSVAQAQFCRDIAAQTDGRKVTTGQLSKFRDSKGPTIGNTSIVFYAAYVFFEKIRVKEGKPKSKHRLEMEKIYPEGFEIDRKRDGRMLCAAGSVVTQDVYGRMQARPPAGGLVRRRR